MTTATLILAAAGLAVGTVIGFLVRKWLAAGKVASAEEKAEHILKKAQDKAQEVQLQAKDKALKVLEDAKRDESERRKEIKQLQDRLEKRESLFDKQLLELEAKKEKLVVAKGQIESAQKKVEELREQAMTKLEEISGMDKETATETVLSRVEEEARDAMMSRIRKVERKTEDEYEIKARNVLSQVIAKVAASHVSETTTTKVQLPSDDMKGRVIGKEGRNIKALEELTGTEIVVDDTPNIITVSGFSPIRRQVARLALESLISDGRIHPTKIEDAVLQAKKDLAKDIKKAGEDALYECGISIASIDPKLVSILGRLKYRTSYGQNVLRHSVEVALLGHYLAKEVGADAQELLKGGLFHDIGKAVDHDVPGAHPEIGVNILKKFGFPENIWYHCLSHHEDKPKNIEGYICKAADAISGARPGARKDTLENYVQRLEELERVATSFTGVQHAYAIQAGREIRVFVSPQQLDDVGAWQLARDIAQKCEQELQYPGEIKINVIRETRAVEYAR